jgi:hypothetical protein
MSLDLGRAGGTPWHAEAGQAIPPLLPEGSDPVFGRSPHLLRKVYMRDFLAPVGHVPDSQVSPTMPTLNVSELNVVIAVLGTYHLEAFF